MAKKSVIKQSFRPGKKELQRRAAIAQTMNICEAVKMITFYVLRNEGWGATRLKRFSDKWNEYLIDVAEGRFTLSDILDVITQETGLTLQELKIPEAMEPANGVLVGGSKR